MMPSTKANASESLENLERVEGGYFLSDENIIALANYLQEVQAENNRLQQMVDALNEALQTERGLTKKLLAEKDNIIELQRLQIEDLKLVYEASKPSLVDKAEWALGGAGVAAAIILLAQLL